MQKIKSAIAFFGSHTEYLFLIIAVPAIITFVVYTPPAWGLDEQVHIARAYQISLGELYPNPLGGGPGHYGGMLPRGLVDNLNHGHSESNSVDRGQPFYMRKDIVDIARNQRIEGKGIKDSHFTEYDFGPTGLYSPIIYAPASTGFFIARHINLTVDGSVELARIMQSISYCIVCFAALFALRRQKIRWLVFITALLPTSIFQASIITADTFTIAAVILFFSLLCRFLSKSYRFNRRYTYALAGASLLLALTKPSYALLLGMLFFIPANKYWYKGKAHYVKYGIMLLSVMTFILTSLYGIGYSDSMIVYKDAETAANISLVGQVGWTISHPFQFFIIYARTFIDSSQAWYQSAVGMLGYNSIATPFFFTILTTISLVFASLYSEVKNIRIGGAMFVAGDSLVFSNYFLVVC
jgi:uncharacterized membrane protein